jgi:putative endonuclease
MVYIVYILRSQKDGKRYIGITNNLERRLQEHNSGKTKSTKTRIPVDVIYTETYDSLREARLREKYLKTSAGRRYLKEISK